MNPIDRDRLNAQKELVAHAFNQAQAYTNVVLLAGYAGFFAIWSFIKTDLTKGQVFWSALLISISLAAYVLWEVYHSYYRSQSLFGLARAVEDPENFHALMERHRVEEQERIVKLRYAWVAAYGITVVTGVLAMFILLWAFVSALWRMYVV